MPSSQEALSNLFRLKSHDLAQYIQNELGVDAAMGVFHADLALILEAVYTTNEINSFSFPDPDQHVKSIIESYLARPRLFGVFGFSPEHLEQRYMALVGRRSTDESEILLTLKKAQTELPSSGSDRLENLAAEVTALGLISRAISRVPSLGIKVDYRNHQLLGGRSHLLMGLSQLPLRVVDFGPGVTAFLRLRDETPHTEQSFFLDRNRYTARTLQFIAHYFGLDYSGEIDSSARVVTSFDGTRLATNQMVEAGLENSIDLVICSRVHYAGEVDLQASIVNGHRLLRPGGWMAIHAVKDVATGQASSKFILNTARSVFGKKATTRREFKSELGVEKKPVGVIDAVFIK